MTDELLHLTEQETVRVVSETAEELEVEGTWGPGGSPPPAHLHPSQDEEFEVTAGQVVAVVDGTERRLGPGDALVIPRGTPHKMFNPGQETATAKWVTRPAGRTAEWFRIIDRLTNGGTRKPPLPAMAKAVTEFDDTFRLAVGPGPVQPVVRAALRVVALADR